MNPIHEYHKDNILDLKFGVDDNTRVNKVGVNNSTLKKYFWVLDLPCEFLSQQSTATTGV